MVNGWVKESRMRREAWVEGSRVETDLGGGRQGVVEAQWREAVLKEEGYGGRQGVEGVVFVCNAGVAGRRQGKERMGWVGPCREGGG